MIISLLALAAAQAVAAPMTDQAAYHECAAMAQTDPAKAVELAGRWLGLDGGIYAYQCRGLAYVSLERWASAGADFEAAATAAQTANDPRRADLWAKAGNAWLASDDAVKARKAFDAALAVDLANPALRGQIHLDRARASVALGDLPGARADIDKGLRLAPSEAFAWYLSSALAQRQNDLARAQADIAKAVELAPQDADILLQAGNVAGLSGDVEAAKALHARAAKASPNSPAGRAALAALTANTPNAEPAKPPTK